MARINLEECWWSDPRRMKLLLKIGFAADSAAVNMWRTAQEFWGKERGLIPKSVFDKLEYAEELIAAGLADVREGSVYVRGSSEHLEWLIEKRELAREAGKKGGAASAKARAEKYGSTVPHNASNDKTSKQNRSNAEAESSEPKPSYSYSGSGSGSGSEDLGTLPSEGEKKRSGKKPPPPGTSVVISAYCDAWKESYKSEKSPRVFGKDAGMLATLTNELGSETAVLYVQAYLQMPDTWFLTKRHDVPTLMANINAITQYIETGKMVTRSVLKEIEEKVDQTQRPERSIADIMADEEARKNFDKNHAQRVLE